MKNKILRSSAVAVAATLGVMGLGMSPAYGKSSTLFNYLPYTVVVTAPTGGTDFTPIAQGGSSFDADFIPAALNGFVNQTTTLTTKPSVASDWYYTGGVNFSSKACDSTGEYISENSLFGRALAIGATAQSALNTCYASGSQSGGLDVIGYSDVPVNQDLNASPTDATLFADSTVSGQTAANLVQIPIVAGGVALIFNNSLNTDAPKQCAKAFSKHGIKLSGTTIAKIFASADPGVNSTAVTGQVETWNSAAISADNTDLSAVTVGTSTVNCLSDLKTLAITPVVRTADSGTTFMLGEYLNAVDSTDFSTVPATLTPPNYNAQANSTALAAAVVATPGSIGYVETSYWKANKSSLSVIKVINSAGAARLPTDAYVTKDIDYALGSAGTIGPGNFSLTTLKDFSVADQACGKCYPISGFSYAIVQKTQPSEASAVAIAKFLDYESHGTATTGGQQFAPANDYTILPTVIQNYAQDQIQTITYTGASSGWVPLAANYNE